MSYTLSVGHPAQIFNGDAGLVIAMDMAREASGEYGVDCVGNNQGSTWTSPDLAFSGWPHLRALIERAGLGRSISQVVPQATVLVPRPGPVLTRTFCGEQFRVMSVLDVAEDLRCLQASLGFPDDPGQASNALDDLLGPDPVHPEGKWAKELAFALWTACGYAAAWRQPVWLVK